MEFNVYFKLWFKCLSDLDSIRIKTEEDCIEYLRIYNTVVVMRNLLEEDIDNMIMNEKDLHLSKDFRLRVQLAKTFNDKIQNMSYKANHLLSTKIQHLRGVYYG